MALPNLLASNITISERWMKLYRTIHTLFLKYEFIHIEDYTQMVNEMNARITTVEANANSSIAAAVTALQAAIVGHNHIAPQAPSGAIPTGPGIITAPPIVTPPPPATLVVPVRVGMERADATLQAQGPALAPLSPVYSAAQALANTKIKLDIGVV